MKRTYTLAPAILVLFISGHGQAADASDVSELLNENIVSTPSKGIETAKEAPATVSVISAEDLHKYGVRSLDEALNFLAHSVIATDPAEAKEFGARGVLLSGDYNNHLLLLLNGHVLNEGWDGSASVDWGLGVPFDLIDHIEVTLGPGSVMYGSDAMLAVINVVTRKASEYRGVSTVTEVETAAPVNSSGSIRFSSPPSPYAGSVGYGSRLGLGYGKELQLLGKPAELVLSTEWRDRMRPAFEVGPQTEIDQTTGQPKNFGPRAPVGVWGGWLNQARHERAPSAFAQLTIEDFSLWVRAAEFYRREAYPDGIGMTTGDFDDPRNSARDRWLNIDARQRLVLSRGATLNVRGFVDIYDYHWNNVSSATEDCPAQLPNGCTQRLVGRAKVYGVELKSNFDWTQAGRFVTLVGAEASLRRVDSDFDFINGPTINSYQKSDAVEAVYAEQKLVPVKDMDINVGARVDHYAQFGAALSPRAVIGFLPWRGGWWKNIYSTAFRAPTFYELNYRDPTQLQNPNLKPEKVWSLESNLEQKLGAQRIAFGIFYSQWHDLVQCATLSDAELSAGIADGSLDPGTSIGYKYRNMATMRSHGGEMRLDGRITPRLSYAMSGTVARAKVDLGDGNPALPLTVTPSVFGNARVAYDLQDGLPTIALAGRLQNAHYADRTFDGGFTSPPRAPTRVDLKLTLSGPIANARGLRYRLGVGYSLARFGSYVIGPNPYAVDATTQAQLSPIERLYVFGGIEFAPER